MVDIAIVGMDCRFPGAADPAELWQLMMTGGDGVTDVPPARWRVDDFYDPDGGPNSTNTRSAGFIADADVFDHEFFGIAPEAAAQTDPQMRLLLHTAWRALEDACLDPRSQAGTATGVYVGVMNSDWLGLVMTDLPGLTAVSGSGNGYSMLANRVSYELDLRGPSVSIDTFCSSSLVATQHACAALRAGEIDQALVGGVSVLVTPAFNIFITQAGLSAPDGRCKPFSAAANGFGRSEGVACLVLRRLVDAVADGLPIYAVLKGGAVNHGGRGSSPTTPSPRAQQAVIAEAYRRAGVEPRNIAYVEAHATGTIIGDRMEAMALGAVHNVQRDQPCALGCVKGNIAHTEGAAGIAGLIKAALALHHGVVPPSRYANTENPRLRLAERGLMLVREPLPLPVHEVAVGVSAFGLGGTNAHVVLGTAPARTYPQERWSEGVLTVSANDTSGLRTAVRRIACDLSKQPRNRVGQFSWTTNSVKASGPVRFALPVGDPDRALATLAQAVRDVDGIGALSGRRADVTVGMLVPDASTAYPGMAAGLHEGCAAFRSALAAVNDVMTPHLSWSVRELLVTGKVPSVDDWSLPASFAAACALGLALAEIGVTPSWLLGAGTGAGAYAAMVLAGATELGDAAKLVAAGGSGAALVDAPASGPGPRVHTDPAGLAEETATHLVELGPGATLAHRVAAMIGGCALPALLPGRDEDAVGTGMLEVVAALYRDGFDPDWAAVYERDQQVLHRLSPYGFAASGRFWVSTTLSGKRIGDAADGAGTEDERRR